VTFRECWIARQNWQACEPGLLESSGFEAGKAAMDKLVRVTMTALAIIAGPVLASLVENPVPPHAQYNSGFQLRGSIAFNGDFQLRGSVR
jgi:hypothetical protein